MATPLDLVPPFKIPPLRGNRLLAVLALGALVAALGFWYWSFQTKISELRLGAGVELRYRKELVNILCQEAAANNLKITVQSSGRATEAIDRVNRGELDAVVIPAGLAVPAENVRQVAMLECETLHLFVRPEVFGQGIAGLKGKRLNLGAAGSGVRILAGEILQFIGMKAGDDYQDDAIPYPELIKLTPEAMPDGVFSLSPLPSPLGERLVHQYGYRLMEMPFGQALGLRKPYLEDAMVPQNTYGVHPAVPEKALHSVGTRSVLIANRDVSKIAVRRLIEVLYESDFARRVGMPPLDANLLQRSGEYPNHAGTIAYLHRHDPWINTDFIDNLMSLRGTIVSVVSALILAWQWYRGRRVEGVEGHLRACSALELEALRASSRGELGEAELRRFLARLAEVKIDVLEKHRAGMISGDQQIAGLLARMEALQQTLPSLLPPARADDRVALVQPPPQRMAA